jgi:hypothetical protein
VGVRPSGPSGGGPAGPGALQVHSGAQPAKALVGWGWFGNLAGTWSAHRVVWVVRERWSFRSAGTNLHIAINIILFISACILYVCFILCRCACIPARPASLGHRCACKARFAWPQARL